MSSYTVRFTSRESREVSEPTAAFSTLHVARHWKVSLKNILHRVVLCANPHHFNADPDPSVHLNADQNPTFYFNANVYPDPATHRCESATTGIQTLYGSIFEPQREHRRPSMVSF